MTAPLTDKQIEAMLANLDRLPVYRVIEDDMRAEIALLTRERDEARAALAEAVEILRCTDCVCTDEARSMTKAFLAKHGGAKP